MPSLSTFSIVGFDPETGDVGVAVQSKFPNVRPVVPWAEAGVGAIATQSFANVSYGSKGLTLLRCGASAEETLKILLANDDQRAKRQVGVIDAQGRAASWTGAGCFEWAGGRVGKAQDDHVPRGECDTLITGAGFAAQGNILVSAATVEALAETYLHTAGSLADKLVAALVAGGQAGGDRRGEQSAALVVKRKNGNYDGTADDYIDIAIYDHPRPLQELERLYQLHQLFFFRSREEDLWPIDAEICRELQTIMSETAYKGWAFYTGPVNGVFDTTTHKALQDFMGWCNYDVRLREDDRIDRVVLADIRHNYAQWKADQS
jgi:uncharacterized Ntn-hydrolase superfamily protein